MEESETQGPDPSGGTSSTDDFVAGVLAQVDEHDRPVVEGYFNTWNGEVSKKFQSIHDEYKPYKDLGSVEEIKAYREVADFLRQDPKGFLSALAEDLGIDPKVLLEQAPTTPQVPVTEPGKLPAGVGGAATGQPPQGSEEYKQLEARLAKQDEILQQLARGFINDQATRREQEENAQLDAWLSEQHSTHGDFDDDWVLLKVYNGMDAEKAIQEYQSKFVTAPRIPTPPVLSGGGIPTGKQGVGDMSRDETKNLVAGILAAHQQGD